MTDIISILLQGNEEFRATFQVKNARTGIRIHLGFFDIITNADPTDCLCLVGTADGTDTTLTPRARANNTAETPAGYVVTLNTWYTTVITLNSNATSATVNIFNDAGTQLYTATLTNIPNVAGRELGCGVAVFEGSIDAAADILWLDYMQFAINRVLTR
jgi:hypothetical protein